MALGGLLAAAGEPEANVCFGLVPPSVTRRRRNACDRLPPFSRPTSVVMALGETAIAGISAAPALFTQ